MNGLTIGERVKNIREQNNLTQEEIGEYLEVDQSLISRCEKNERNFSLGMLEKLSDLFGCTLDCFLEENIDVKPIAMAFRAQTKSSDDLKTIAVINRIAKNLAFMDRLLEEWEIEF